MPGAACPPRCKIEWLLAQECQGGPGPRATATPFVLFAAAAGASLVTMAARGRGPFFETAAPKMIPAPCARPVDPWDRVLPRLLESDSEEPKAPAAPPRSLAAIPGHQFYGPPRGRAGAAGPAAEEEAGRSEEIRAVAAEVSDAEREQLRDLGLGPESMSDEERRQRLGDGRALAAGFEESPHSGAGSGSAAGGRLFSFGTSPASSAGTPAPTATELNAGGYGEEEVVVTPPTQEVDDQTPPTQQYPVVVEPWTPAAGRTTRERMAPDDDGSLNYELTVKVLDLGSITEYSLYYRLEGESNPLMSIRAAPPLLQRPRRQGPVVAATPKNKAMKNMMNATKRQRRSSTVVAAKPKGNAAAAVLSRKTKKTGSRARSDLKNASRTGKSAKKKGNPWIVAVQRAPTALKLEGFVAVNGKTVAGAALYKKAKEFYTVNAKSSGAKAAAKARR